MPPHESLSPNSFLAETTTVTRLTSLAPAAIAVIEIRGSAAIDCVLRCWRPARNGALQLNEIRYGRWVGTAKDCDFSPRKGEDVIVCLTRAIDPKVVEIHCHGGRWAAEQILDDLVAQGAIRAEPHLDTTASSSNSESDHWSRLAWQALPQASTPLTTRLLLKQSRGTFAALIDSLKTLQGSADQAGFCQNLAQWIDRYDIGKHLLVPWKLVITGPPNTGKSSLLNAILGYDRAIVHSQAGTTRDLVAERTVLEGWPFEVLDTAGLRESTDAIERIGVRRAIEVVQAADLALLLIDPQQGWTDWHQVVWRTVAGKALAVHTKQDLGFPLPQIPAGIPYLGISSRSTEGLASLYRTIIDRLIPPSFDEWIAIPFHPSQRAYLADWQKRTCT